MEQKTATITLDTPIKRGEADITEITVRKPNAGAMRGLSITNVMNLDVNSLIALIPRVSTPSLTDDDVRKMDPADLLQIGQEIAGFLVPKSFQPETA